MLVTSEWISWRAILDDVLLFAAGSRFLIDSKYHLVKATTAT